MRKHNRLKVGLFVTTTFLLLAGGMMWLAGSRFFRAVDSYEIVFAKSVSGLLPGARVEYQGVTVGKVGKMRLTHETPPRVMVQVDLKPGTPVRTDTYASLIGSFVTSIRYIELAGGKSSQDLEEGGTIPAKESALEDIAHDLSEQAKAVMDRVDKQVLNEQNIEAITTLIQNLSQMSTSANVLMKDVNTGQNRVAVSTMLQNAAQAAVGLRRATDSINGMRDDARATLAELRETVAATQKLAAQVNLLAQHVDTVVGQNQSEIARLLSNMADAALQLRQASAVVRDDPSRLIWGSSLPAREIPDK